MASSTAVDRYESATKPSRRKAQASNRRVTVVQPTSAEQIGEVLANPGSHPSPVRPIGSGSSVTRCARTAHGTIIDMSMLDRVLSIAEDTVTVQAGIRLRDLAEYLAAENMELVGSIENPNRTVGGAISSGTLGGGLPGDGSQLASTVVQITLINGLGRKVDVTEKMPDLLALTRMSYGLLGIVYSAKLRIRPISSYTIRSSKFSFDEFASVIPTLLQVQGAVRASLMPFRNKVYVELRYPSEGEGKGKGSALPWKLRDWATNKALPSVVRSVAKVVPVKNIRDPLIDGFTEATHVLFNNTFASSGSNSVEQTGRFKRLTVDPATESCTWYFAADKFPSVLAAYYKFCSGHYRKTRFRCDLPAEVWRLEKDQSCLLSPSFDSPVFALKLRSVAADEWDDYLLEFAELAAHFDGIPVFNQTKGFKPGYANKVYGDRIGRFCSIRSKLDPNNRLLNQFFAEHLR
jgi:hypothetical protein